MKGKWIYLAVGFVVYIFFHFFNGHVILRKTQAISQLEKSFKAERNINTELMIEQDDLISGRNISSTIGEEMAKFTPQKNAQNVIYIQEPATQKQAVAYCIIDLITPKAQATTAIQTD